MSATSSSATPTASGKQTVLGASFNQDHSCFALGTTQGFWVWLCDPLKERFHREWGMGVGVVEMLMRCNILALVGGGPNPKFPPNKLVIWDDYQNKCIAELGFEKPVQNVRIRREVLVAVLAEEIHVYHFNNLNVLTSLYTTPNPLGLCELSSVGVPISVVAPGSKPGLLRVESVDPNTSQSSGREIPAHKNPLLCLAVSEDGRLVATASDKGTIVRCFDVSEEGGGRMVREFRRGTKPADIRSMAFSPDKSMLAVASDNGTVHIFDVSGTASDAAGSSVAVSEQSPSLTSSQGASAPPSQSRERSFCRIKTRYDRAIVCFGAERRSIVIVSYGGLYSKHTFGVEKGQWVSHPELVDAALFHCAAPSSL